MSMPSAFLLEKTEFYRQRQQELQQKKNRLTFFRLLLFIVLLCSLAAAYDYGAAFFIPAVAAAVLFALCVRQYTKLSARELYTRSYLLVLKQYAMRRAGSWKDFSEDGQHFLSDDSPEGRDLDLFGRGSLYQWLCNARTMPGQEQLQQALSPTPPERELILARQQAVAAFIADPEFSLELEAQLGLLPQSHDPREALAAFAENTNASPMLFRFFSRFPVFTFLSIFLYLIDVSGPEIPAFFLFCQFAISGLFFAHMSRLFSPLEQCQKAWQPYSKIFTLLETHNFSSPLLQDLQKELLDPIPASEALRRLDRIGACVHMRRNLFFSFFANTLVLWDFLCLQWFSHWQENYEEKIPQAIDQLAQTELFLSLAVPGHVREAWVFPQILPEELPALRAENIVHPLLSEDAIGNSLAAGSETIILTGSNMSGKTTFMRTLAVNAVLAYAGAPVCAEKFALSRMQLFTSMRIQDDTMQGISTFYAEILRIKRMIAYSREKVPMFALIDEIFKGTNSADRITGARETLRSLMHPWILTIVSTHDFELCTMADDSALPVKNYHFSEYYTDNEIHFDYLLKPGRCQSTNARYLLKMAGILADVPED